MRDYVQRRHGKDWNHVKQRMDKLLEQKRSFIEPLTRLPLIATLVAELLPTVGLSEVPKTRWELFNTLLLSGLLRRDMPDSDAEVVTNNFRQLPPERQEALLLLSDLALEGLLATPPKLVFRYADILAKSKGRSKAVRADVLKVAKSVLVSFCEVDETQEEVTYYHFLHLSFQEFFAAMAVKHPMVLDDQRTVYSRLAFCVNMLMIGERFDNFWLFAAGFFKTEPFAFLRTLFSMINFYRPHQAWLQRHPNEILILMLQEMFPESSDLTRKKHALVLELVARQLNREVSCNYQKQPPSSHYIIFLVFAGHSKTFCHAVRLLPDLIKVALPVDSRHCTMADALDALQHQHKLRSLSLLHQLSPNSVLNEEMKSLTTLLETRPLIELRLSGLSFSAPQLQSLAGALSKMSHSLKCLHLSTNAHPVDAFSTEAIYSAISKRHTKLLSMELSGFYLSKETAIPSLASLLRKLKHLQRLYVGLHPMSPGTIEMLLSSIQASRSLTALEVETFHFGHESKDIGDNEQLQLRKAILQLSRVAIHHKNVNRLEICSRLLNIEYVMYIVEELVKTKGEPHQLRQLSLSWSGHSTIEERNHIEERIQKEQLKITLTLHPVQWVIILGDTPQVTSHGASSEQGLPAWSSQEV